ncbi:MAG: sigma-70 family RNA polymerase sigma factor [Chloroflexi bacterium]|nr:sigma-70 family RNA polymerase sigma factor [Chloroflexota bacterium]
MINETEKAAFSMEALRGGDREEFARFVETYSTQVYRLGLKMLNDPQDAEDMLQETFIKAFKALPTFEGRSSLSTWLYRIAINEALMTLRKRRPNQVSVDEGVETVEGEIEPREILDWCCLPEREMLSVESRKFMNEAIQQLSPALRAVFVLRDIEGLSIKETADTLNLSETAVKTRLLRARLRLRELLTVYYGERVVESKRA